MSVVYYHRSILCSILCIVYYHRSILWSILCVVYYHRSIFCSILCSIYSVYYIINIGYCVVYILGSVLSLSILCSILCVVYNHRGILCSILCVVYYHCVCVRSPPGDAEHNMLSNKTTALLPHDPWDLDPAWTDPYGLVERGEGAFMVYLHA